MAALAIPIVVLGSLYILSEQEKNEEFTNEVVTEQQKEELQKEDFLIIIQEKIIELNQTNNNYINSYNNPNQHTDKYYDNTNNHNNTNTNINLLSGQNINQNEFQHNNMKPFFGGKLKGITKDFN